MQPQPTEILTTAESVELQHLHLVAMARERTRRDVLRLRAGAVVAITAFITVHGFAAVPRYMFLGPILAVAAWAHEAALSHRMVALEWLERAVRGGVTPRPPRLSLDTANYASQASWRRAVLGPSRAAMYVPLCVVSAAVAIDAQGLRSSDVPGELAWYLAVGFMTFAVLVLVAWSWWVDFLAVRTPVSAVVVAPAAALEAPATVVVTPSGSIPGPFPVRKGETTQNFGTPVQTP